MFTETAPARRERRTSDRSLRSCGCLGARSLLAELHVDGAAPEATQGIADGVRGALRERLVAGRHVLELERSPALEAQLIDDDIVVEVRQRALDVAHRDEAAVLAADSVVEPLGRP
jgi:hypothetical protein